MPAYSSRLDSTLGRSSLSLTSLGYFAACSPATPRYFLALAAKVLPASLYCLS